MSLEGDIRTALLPTCMNVYPDVAPNAATYPLTIYQQVGGTAQDFMEGKVPDKANARVQVWVWADTRLESSAIARAQRIALVEGALRATTLNAPVSEYNEAIGKYGCRTDYSVWYTP